MEGSHPPSRKTHCFAVRVYYEDTDLAVRMAVEALKILIEKDREQG